MSNSHENHKTRYYKKRMVLPKAKPLKYKQI